MARIDVSRVANFVRRLPTEPIHHAPNKSLHPRLALHRFARCNTSQSTQNKDPIVRPPATTIALSVAKSAASIAAGVAAATYLPVSLPQIVVDATLAGCSTFATHPIARAKLRCQIHSPASAINGIGAYAAHEFRFFSEEIMDILSKPHSHAGGLANCVRAGVAKGSMFLGFSTIFPLLPNTLPSIVRSLSAGAISGFMQGSIVSFPEHLQAIFHKHPNKSLGEAIRDAGRQIKSEQGSPIVATGLRNSLFDAVFFTCTKEGNISFGPAASVSMISAYYAEKIRSLLHQGKSIEEVITYFKENSKEHIFSGALIKGLEFLLTFIIFGKLREKYLERKQSIC